MTPSTRLPATLLDRYRAGDSVGHLARDYAIPLEQVRWGIGLAELAESHDQLRGALILAGRRIRKLTFGRRDDPALVKLRHVLREARAVRRQWAR